MEETVALSVTAVHEVVVHGKVALLVPVSIGIEGAENRFIVQIQTTVGALVDDSSSYLGSSPRVRDLDTQTSDY